MAIELCQLIKLPQPRKKNPGSLCRLHTERPNKSERKHTDFPISSSKPQNAVVALAVVITVKGDTRLQCAAVM